MESNPFQNQRPYILDNPRLRTPQKEAYEKLSEFAEVSDDQNREAGIVLPVGCGKSGCITLAPFAFRATRTLVVAPNVKIAQQLEADFEPTNGDMFYIKCDVLPRPPYPEPVEIRGKSTNLDDLEKAHVVLTNIQQLQGQSNRWLQNMTDDFFDLILFDEGHHSVARSWEILRDKFPAARIASFSATPRRADGRLMAGSIIYSYPVFQAIEKGYVKRLKALVLNPKTLRYVREEDGNEIEVSLDEVRRLGEEDPDFRRSIVTSQETLDTIVDASIRELDRLRTETGEKRLKIIASALHYEHCRQIVEAYRSRNCRANYVHSLEESSANARVLQQLENHELDVIVQVRKLGEGFDHKLLAVAAVFSIFANLSPFVQFVGRIMRVIEQDAPNHVKNQGTVVFHAGANVASRWEDFQDFSGADQDYFDQLLPLEELNFESSNELTITPPLPRNGYGIEVRSQGEIDLQEIQLMQQDDEAMAAINVLNDRGYTGDRVKSVLDTLQRVPVTLVRRRQAMRSSLDMRVRNTAGKILADRKINPEGHKLDRHHRGRSNFVVLKSAIDRRINTLVGHSSDERHEFTQDDLDLIDQRFDSIVEDVIKEVFDATD